MTTQARALELCAQLRAVHEPATKGRWEAEEEEGANWGVCAPTGDPDPPHPSDIEIVGLRMSATDARAISLAHNSIMGLVEFVEGIARKRACTKCQGSGHVDGPHKPGYTHYETDAGEPCPAYHYGLASCPDCTEDRELLEALCVRLEEALRP